MNDLDHKCPKCGEQMNVQKAAYALVKYVDKPPRGAPNIDAKDALPVDAYFCPSCRFVELFGS